MYKGNQYFRLGDPLSLRLWHPPSRAFPLMRYIETLILSARLDTRLTVNEKKQAVGIQVTLSVLVDVLKKSTACMHAIGKVAIKRMAPSII